MASDKRCIMMNNNPGNILLHVINHTEFKFANFKRKESIVKIIITI